MFQGDTTTIIIEGSVTQQCHHLNFKIMNQFLSLEVMTVIQTLMKIHVHA